MQPQSARAPAQPPPPISAPTSSTLSSNCRILPNLAKVMLLSDLALALFFQNAVKGTLTYFSATYLKTWHASLSPSFGAIAYICGISFSLFNILVSLAWNGTMADVSRIIEEGRHLGVTERQRMVTKVFFGMAFSLGATGPLVGMAETWGFTPAVIAGGALCFIGELCMYVMKNADTVLSVPNLIQRLWGTATISERFLERTTRLERSLCLLRVLFTAGVDYFIFKGLMERGLPLLSRHIQTDSVGVKLLAWGVSGSVGALMKAGTLGLADIQRTTQGLEAPQAPALAGCTNIALKILVGISIANVTLAVPALAVGVLEDPEMKPGHQALFWTGLIVGSFTGANFWRAYFLKAARSAAALTCGHRINQRGDTQAATSGFALLETPTPPPPPPPPPPGTNSTTPVKDAAPQSTDTRNLLNPTRSN